MVEYIERYGDGPRGQRFSAMHLPGEECDIFDAGTTAVGA